MQCFLVSSLQRAPTPAKNVRVLDLQHWSQCQGKFQSKLWIIFYTARWQSVTASTAVESPNTGASMTKSTYSMHFLLEDPARSELLGELLGMLCRHPPKVAIGLRIWITAAKFRQQLPHRNPLNLFGKALGIQQEP